MKNIIFVMLLSLFVSTALFSSDNMVMDTKAEKLEKELKKNKISDSGLKIVKEDYSSNFKTKEMMDSKMELQKLHKEFKNLLLADKVDEMKLREIKTQINEKMKMHIEAYDNFIISIATKLSKKDREIVAKVLKMHKEEKKSKNKK
jgi:hypothetical protein